MSDAERTGELTRERLAWALSVYDEQGIAEAVKQAASPHIIAAARRLPAMRPAKADEVARAMDDYNEEVCGGEMGDAGASGFRAGYRAAERRLLPFTDEPPAAPGGQR